MESQTPDPSLLDVTGNLLESHCSSEESGVCKGGETSPTTRLETGEVNFTSVRWSSRRVKVACYTAMRCDVLHMQCMSDVFVLYIRTDVRKQVFKKSSSLPAYTFPLSYQSIGSHTMWEKWIGVFPVNMDKKCQNSRYDKRLTKDFSQHFWLLRKESVQIKLKTLNTERVKKEN